MGNTVDGDGSQNSHNSGYWPERHEGNFGVMGMFSILIWVVDLEMYT